MKNFVKSFFKGIVVGMGGIAPGLSGSVLLVIFGLYQRVIDAIGTFFKDIKRNFTFLLPIVLGCGVGVLLFSKLVDFLLAVAPMQTRFTFLGLVVGTLPLFYKEVKAKGFSKKYYIYILAALAVGLFLFGFNDSFPQISNPNALQSVLLGVAVAGSSIVPGVDSAVILSSFGLYEAYVTALANLDFAVLIPALFGVVGGMLLISFIMSRILARFYTATFSIVFGFFISIIPSVLDESCVIGWNFGTVISFICMLLGFALSFYLGDIEANNKRIRRLFGKGEPSEKSEERTDSDV